MTLESQSRASAGAHCRSAPLPVHFAGVATLERHRERRFCVLLLVVLLLTGCRAANPPGLGDPDVIAPGVRLYHLTDPSLLEPPGPVNAQILRLDPERVELRSALGQDQVMGTETVAAIAERHGAVAAVNAGFFAPGGDPLGVLQVAGELVSDSGRARGAVAVTTDRSGRLALLFDVVTVEAVVRFDTDDGEETIPIAGIDTTRQRGRLMLFTSKYHDHTDTAPRGVEWVLDGEPLTVRARRHDAGSTPIPAGGFVLSYGGLDPPASLAGLGIGSEVTIERRFATQLGTPPNAWRAAEHVIGGAGLLVRDGRAVEDWSAEGLREAFAADRHPRTIIGVDDAGEIWLATVDGRNPQISLGMTFIELQRLAARLRLRQALNLDGGGSTTMVVGGSVVNHPSDAAGPRKVSDALLVLPR